MNRHNFSPQLQSLRPVEKKHDIGFAFDDSGGGHLAPTLDLAGIISGHAR